MARDRNKVNFQLNFSEQDEPDDVSESNFAIATKTKTIQPSSLKDMGASRRPPTVPKVTTKGAAVIEGIPARM